MVEQWLYVDWQAKNCFIRPKDGLSPKLLVQVKGTLEFFRINRRSRLLKERNDVRTKVIEALASSDGTQAKHYANRFRSHSLVARQILTDTGRADLIPTPVEELWSFIHEEIALLEDTLHLVDQNPGDTSLEDEAKEYRWLLAALWCDPPVGTSSDVETLLPQPLREHLQPFASSLA